MTLKSLGWSDSFREEFQSLDLSDGIVPARVSRNSKHIYHVICEKGKFIARVSGAFRHRTKELSDYPAVGDWVAIKISPDGLEAEIRALFSRRTIFSRQAVSASGTESKSYEQIVATNVDVAFLVAALDGARGFNLRRLERYLTLTRNSGADPVILLNKADLSSELEFELDQAQSIAAGAPVHAICALEENGVDSLRQYVGDGKTVVLLGPSGIGKSTIINGIAEEEIMRTNEVRKGDSRGRHTTTWSELLVLRTGGALIDTPGLRDVQLWSDESSVGETFREIIEIAEQCRFRDCNHSTEPGCAVIEALGSGKISESRLISYKKQKQEINDSSRRRELGEKKKHEPPVRPRRKVQRKRK